MTRACSRIVRAASIVVTGTDERVTVRREAKKSLFGGLEPFSSEKGSKTGAKRKKLKRSVKSKKGRFQKLIFNTPIRIIVINPC